MTEISSCAPLQALTFLVQAVVGWFNPLFEPTDAQLTARTGIPVHMSRVAVRLVVEEPSRRINSIAADEAHRLGALRANKSISAVERRGRFNTLLNDASRRAGIPRHRVFVRYELKTEKPSTLPVDFYVLGPALLNCRDFAAAKAARNSSSGYYSISFQFTPESSLKFQELTRNHVGKRLAITINQKLVMAAVIREKIEGGNGVISGSFGEMEAKAIARSIRRCVAGN